jgi:hypothetical protein
MEKENVKSLWKKLEVLLSRLEISSQIWLLEKFIEEAKKSFCGKMLIYFIKLLLLLKYKSAQIQHKHS